MKYEHQNTKHQFSAQKAEAPPLLDLLRQFIAEKVLLTEEEWVQTASYFEMTNLAADTLLLREGQICCHLYFLASGIVRFFEWNNGTDTTKFFLTGQCLFTSQQSFATQSIAHENIEAIVDSTFLLLPFEALQQLYTNVPKWHIFIRRILQEANIFNERMYMDSITHTAEDRYRTMLRDKPEIALHVPLKYIASYLGITPESLSRIRKKITEK
jgi:CRP-like cAMP-binding protein